MTFKQLIRFTNDAGGLQKILRLLRALSQILAVYALTAEDAKIWLHLRDQFGLGRRYFRVFKFLDCFSRAFDCFYGYTGFESALGVSKWSCMGGYLILESLTILDAIGAWPTQWAAACMIEANKLWFYSLAFSIVWGMFQLLYRDFGEQAPKTTPGKSPENANGRRAAVPKVGGDRKGARSVVSEERRRVIRGMLSDCFDLFIPGSVVGWISATSATVGYATVISTVLSFKDIWDRLQ